MRSTVRNDGGAIWFRTNRNLLPVHMGLQAFRLPATVVLRPVHRLRHDQGEPYSGAAGVAGLFRGRGPTRRNSALIQPKSSALPGGAFCLTGRQARIAGYTGEGLRMKLKRAMGLGSALAACGYPTNNGWA